KLSHGFGGLVARIAIVWKIISNASLAAMAGHLYSRSNPNRCRRFERQIQYLGWVCFQKRDLAPKGNLLRRSKES
ncbi:PIPO, partial [Lettuce mosaic virus]